MSIAFHFKERKDLSAWSFFFQILYFSGYVQDEINMDESGSSDNVKSPEGDSDSTKVPEGASDSTKVPEGSLDSARAPEGTSESAKSSEESLQKEGERTKESPKTDKVCMELQLIF